MAGTAVALAAIAAGPPLASQASTGPAVAGTPGQGAAQAPAAVACEAEALRRAARAGVEIVAAERVSDTAGVRCRVRGRVTTEGEGAPPGQARFELNLPDGWNGKLLFLGGSGFDGVVPSAAPEVLARGYVTLGTDSGHAAPEGHPNPGVYIDWVRTASGERNDAALADYGHRARHQVNLKVRPLANAYYGQPIRYAYFMGCSGGGREALIEAEWHPQDFDGFISGNPRVSARGTLLAARNLKLFLDTPLPYAAFAAIDRSVMAQCDAADGVADGLVQTPFACDFDPRRLVQDAGLTPAQAEAVGRYLSAVRDTEGRFVTYGAPLTGMGELAPDANMGGVARGPAGGLTGLSTVASDPPPRGGPPQPWGDPLKSPIDWPLAFGVLSGLAFGDPDLDIVGPRIVAADYRLQPSAVAAIDERVARYSVTPSRMGPFFASGRKLIVYHGFDDTITDAYAVIGVYRQIVAAAGGPQAAARSARLFMAPGMQHCRGGSGPNSFDALGAMEAWVERGIAPDALLATKYRDNDPRKPAERTLPLCPYPAAARFDGRGDPRVASSWRCDPQDQRLQMLGRAGRTAGSDQDLPQR